MNPREQTESGPQAGDAARFAASRREGSLLVLLHDCPFRAGAGGTECHTLDLLAQLKLKHAVMVYPSNPHLVSAVLIADGDFPRAVHCRFPLREPLSLYMHRHAEAEELLLYVARLYGARAVLIQHLRRWPLAAVEKFQRAGLPYVCVTHDFFAVCPNLNLLNPRTLRLCGAHSGACGAGILPAPEQAGWKPAPQNDSEECLREYFRTQQITPPCNNDSGRP